MNMAPAPEVMRRIAELRADLNVPVIVVDVHPDGSAVVWIPDAEEAGFTVLIDAAHFPMGAVRH
jgi:hypothetical protein